MLSVILPILAIFSVISRLHQYVRSGGLDSVSVFMKVEHNKLQSNRFYQFDKHHSLGDNLSGKTVVEYPTLHVVMADSTSNYPVVSDQMNEKESNSNEPTNYQCPSPPLSVSTPGAGVTCSTQTAISTGAATLSGDSHDSGLVQCSFEAEKSVEEGELSAESHKLRVVCAVEQSEDRDSSVWSEEEGETDSLRTVPNALQMIAAVYDS